VARGYLNRPGQSGFRVQGSGFRVSKSEGSDQVYGKKPQDLSNLSQGSPQTLNPEPRTLVLEPGTLYCTGDLARFRPDGIIEYLGRIDDQVKIRGYRVELGEIEAVLMQHPQVAEAVVLAKPDESGHKRLIAFVKSKPEFHSDKSDTPTLEPGTRNPEPGTLAFAVFLGDQLPEYMIPVAFVVLEQFPMLPNGKVDRKALLRVPVAIEAPAKEVTLPQTQIEETLARIWAQVLRVPQVGVHDNFFELGGDSILTIQIVARAGQAGLKLSPKDIFQRQTIAELATIVEAGALISNEQGLISGTVPLTPIQHWFFEQPLSNPHHWNQAFLFEVPLALETEKLKLAVKHVLDHHDAVRMRFTKTDTGYVQTNLSAEPGEVVRFHDLSDVPDEGLASEIEQIAQAEQASLHISDGPLVRVTYLATGLGRTNRLLVVIHHLVIDAVSWRILLEDLISAYRQLSQNQSVQLPAKTTSFKDWAERLHIYAQSPALTQEAPFWLNTLKPPVVRIPVDFIKGENTVASAAEVVGALDEAQTTALLRQVPKAFGTQINEVLLTAVTRALSDWILETLPTSTTFNNVTDFPPATRNPEPGTRNPALLIDFEGHGREELFPDVNLSRTIGWFTTLFPVRLELSTTQPVPEHLKTIQQRLQQIPNRGIGYGILRYLNQDHSLQAQFSAAAHAEIAFNYFGQLDAHPGTATGVPGFRVAPESPGSPADAQGIRSHLIEVQASITGGKLKMVWTYSQNLHSPVIISRLSHLCLDTLTTLISQTQLAAQSRMVQPEDFPLANLDKNKLGKVLSQLGKKK
ncbi:MAG TPA: condensation domain-containing protein, partial [Acidobacteriota bacterium]|nr:condensation domain-containing protein [Acidobacteriota bacterium]